MVFVSSASPFLLYTEFVGIGSYSKGGLGVKIRIFGYFVKKRSLKKFLNLCMMEEGNRVHHLRMVPYLEKS